MIESLGSSATFQFHGHQSQHTSWLMLCIDAALSQLLPCMGADRPNLTGVDSSSFLGLVARAQLPGPSVLCRAVPLPSLHGSLACLVMFRFKATSVIDLACGHSRKVLLSFVAYLRLGSNASIQVTNSVVHVPFHPACNAPWEAEGCYQGALRPSAQNLGFDSCSLFSSSSLSHFRCSGEILSLDPVILQPLKVSRPS